jgi:hypothetical protein
MVRDGPPEPAPYTAEQMRRDARMRRLAPRRMVIIAAVALVVVVAALLLALWG